MTPTDKQALVDCMTIARRDPEYAAHLDDMLKNRSWTDVARSACWRCQREALRLKPWQIPPMYLDVDELRREWDAPGQQILRRMLAAGVSRYAPDPLQALKGKAA